jgi:hypothetical protein
MSPVTYPLRQAWFWNYKQTVVNKQKFQAFVFINTSFKQFKVHIC